MKNKLKQMSSSLLVAFIAVASASSALAEATNSSVTSAASFATLNTKTASFLSNINGVLSPMGVGIATIAVFVFGYQVSFGGKSPAAAAPILVGGLIIGASAAIAGMLVGTA